jgi:hypothetical protein
VLLGARQTHAERETVKPRQPNQATKLHFVISSATSLRRRYAVVTRCMQTEFPIPVPVWDT